LSGGATGVGCANGRVPGRLGRALSLTGHWRRGEDTSHPVWPPISCRAVMMRTRKRRSRRERRLKRITESNLEYFSELVYI